MVVFDGAKLDAQQPFINEMLNELNDSLNEMFAETQRLFKQAAKVFQIG